MHYLADEALWACVYSYACPEPNDYYYNSNFFLTLAPYCRQALLHKQSSFQMSQVLEYAGFVPLFMFII